MGQCKNCKGTGHIDLKEGNIPKVSGDIELTMKGNKVTASLPPKGELLKKINADFKADNPLGLPKDMTAEITDLEVISEATDTSPGTLYYNVTIRFIRKGRAIASAKLKLGSIGKKEMDEIAYQALPGASADDILAMDKIIEKGMPVGRVLK